MTLRTETEQRVEVHSFRGGWIAVGFVAFLALALGSFLPKYFPQATLLDLALLVTLYFALARRNPATGLILGMIIGLMQDAMSAPRVPLGYYGIAKTLVGFVGSSVGARLDTEHPVARAALAFGAYHLQQAALVVLSRWLMGHQEPFFSMRTLLASLLNALLSFVFFPLLDKLRRPL
jgi:rod shape-determining protein MreD